MLRSSPLLCVLALGSSLVCPACKDDPEIKASSSAGGTAAQGGSAGADAGGPARAGSPSEPSAGAAGSEPEGADLCPPQTGVGTVHEAYVTGDETWTAAASPHLVPEGLVVNAVLTLEACAVVRVAAGRDLLVNGKLLAQGEYRAATGASPEALFLVRIERLDAKPWGAIKSSTADGEIQLTATLVEGGGAVPEGTEPQQTGMVVLEGERQKPLAERLKLSGAVLQGSSSQGVVLTNNAAFMPESTLSVTGSAGYPVLVGAQAAGTVPELVLADNATDAILVGTSEPLGDAGPSDVVLANGGYPYVIGSDLDTTGLVVGTGNGNAATLMIEPGVELRFPAGGGLAVEGPDGSLLAKGTKAKPVVFTTAVEPAVAGAWLGLNFRGEIGAATALDHVSVRYAGSLDTETRGFSCGSPPAPASSQQQTMGAVYLSLDVPPVQSFISNSLFSDSASNGIDRGYTGDPIDFSDSNSFERLAFCVQTEPKPALGACPDQPSCSQLP